MKLINCDGDEDIENVTISGLMAKLFEKAASKNIGLKEYLSFVVTPFPEDDYQAASAELEVHLKEFEFTIDNLVEKVPETMMLGKLNVRTLLRQKMDSISKKKAAHLKLNQEIQAELSFDRLIQCDKLFYDSCKQWFENSVDKHQMKFIDNKISFHILPVYTKFIKQFRQDLAAVILERRGVDTSIESVNSMYNSLYFEKTKEDVGELTQYIDELSAQLTKFLTTLEKLINVMKSFNNQRVIWVEYFIGIRKQIGSTERTLVEPFTKVSKVKKDAKGAYDAGVDNCQACCTGANAKYVAKGCVKGCFKGCGRVLTKTCIKLAKGAL